jgi:DNA-binding transcriptional regulator YdaS (Cro superfamily)
MGNYKDALAAFLAKDENAETALASQVGKSQAAINRYRNGKRFPNADTAREIERATEGQVPFAVWQAEMARRVGIAA